MTMERKLIIADKIILGIDKHGSPEILEKFAILTQNSKIETIAPTTEIRKKHPGITEVGGQGLVAIPGLVNAHHHVGLTPFQLGARDQPLELWFAERLSMREINPRLDTIYSAFEMISSGVTTVQHLHSRAPGDTRAVLKRANAIINTYKEIGMRASYSFAFRDQNRMIYAADEEFIRSLPLPLRAQTSNYLKSFKLPLNEQIEVFYELQKKYNRDELIEIQIAPSNLHWLSDNALESTAKVAQATSVPIHMHLLETPYQAEYARRRTGGSALEFIDKFELVGPQLTIGHGVWMTKDDIMLLADRGGFLCHNCSSNLRLKSGIVDLNSFINHNIPVALGIDEAGINDDRDMLQEMRLALTLHRPPGHESPYPSAAEIFKMATENGAATTPFSKKIGRLKPGLMADIVLLNWTSVTWPYQDLNIPIIEVLLRRARREAVHTVMIGGEIVFQKGRFTKVDKNSILEKINQDLTRTDTVEEAKLRKLAANIMPVLRRFYKDWY